MHKLQQLLKGRVAIVGIGNTLRGDDGVGPYIANALKSTRIDVLILDAGSTPENYLGKIVKFKPDMVLLIDALELGGKAGEYRITGAAKLKDTTLSTHNFSSKLLIDYLKEEADADVFMLGIQPESIKLGEGLSDDVKKTADSVIDFFAGLL